MANVLKDGQASTDNSTYNNGTLTATQVGELQKAIDDAGSSKVGSYDNMYGSQSSSAAVSNASDGTYGLDLTNANDAYRYYVLGERYYASSSSSGYTAPSVSKVEQVDYSGLYDTLKQQYSAAAEQAQMQVDYATSQEINELQRAKEDAAEQYQTQRNQIDIDEAKALDNQALYAEARGDKGGIGQAQYNAIMNTAMTNRVTVNQAQTKLSTDTARQISDLRAQGQYEKADGLLTLTQNYLSQLQSIYQWGTELNVSIQEFNTQVDEWLAEYELQVAELMGEYQGQPTLAAQSQMSDTALTLMSAGIMPSASQLSALGITSSQASSYIASAKLSSSSGGSDSTGSDYSAYFADLNNQSFSTVSEVIDFLQTNRNLDYAEATKIANAYFNGSGTGSYEIVDTSNMKTFEAGVMTETEYKRTNPNGNYKAYIKDKIDNDTSLTPNEVYSLYIYYGISA